MCTVPHHAEVIKCSHPRFLLSSIAIEKPCAPLKLWFCAFLANHFYGLNKISLHSHAQPNFWRGDKGERNKCLRHGMTIITQLYGAQNRVIDSRSHLISVIIIRCNCICIYCMCTRMGIGSYRRCMYGFGPDQVLLRLVFLRFSCNG